MVVLVLDNGVAASIKAINGYFAFHRLLLAFVEMYPRLRTKVNQNVRDFIRNEKERTKEVLPSLGEFLALLSIADQVSFVYNILYLFVPSLISPFCISSFLGTENSLWPTSLRTLIGMLFGYVKNIQD